MLSLGLRSAHMTALRPCRSANGSSQVSPTRSLESQRPPEPRRWIIRRLRTCLVERAWWTALIAIVILSLSVTSELLAGSSNLHLRAATLRAVGGSARVGAHFMCFMRTAEAALIWLFMFALRGELWRRHQPIPLLPASSMVGAASSWSHSDCAIVVTGGSISANGSSNASPVGPVGALCEPLPIGRWPDPSYPLDCASPPEVKALMRRGGSSLLCSLSGWVWVILGIFSVLGSACSLLVSIGGHSAPGFLGELMSHDGPLGRRSVLGRSLPILAWIAFELGSAGALYVATLSLVAMLPQVIGAIRGMRGGSGTLLSSGAGGVEPLSHKLRTFAVHTLPVLIASLELRLNDLPVLWQHMPLAVLMGCCFSGYLLSR